MAKKRAPKKAVKMTFPKIERLPRAEFMEGISGDNNHRLLMYEALESTKGDVVEFGAGNGSTQYIRDYCKDNDRAFSSFDNSKEWAEKHGATFVPNNEWDFVRVNGSVILIDHAPGEQRHIDIRNRVNDFDIFVIHDSEPVGAGDYRYETIWSLFKYRVDVKVISPDGINGAWATAVSNTIDVTKWKGKSFKDYIIS